MLKRISKLPNLFKNLKVINKNSIEKSFVDNFASKVSRKFGNNRTLIDHENSNEMLKKFMIEKKLAENTSTRFDTQGKKLRRVSDNHFLADISIDPKEIDLFELEAPEIRKNTDLTINYPAYSWIRLTLPLSTKTHLR